LHAYNISLTYTYLPGNDPLTDDENNHDINSVAGVLKLYFRGLEKSLLPKERFNDLLSCISK
jgi:SLIT-ROBO Rho GTPase activating protein